MHLLNERTQRQAKTYFIYISSYSNLALGDKIQLLVLLQTRTLASSILSKMKKSERREKGKERKRREKGVCKCI